MLKIWEEPGYKAIEVIVGAKNTKYIHNSNNCDLEGGYSVLGCARRFIIRNYAELVKLNPIYTRPD